MLSNSSMSNHAGLVEYQPVLSVATISAAQTVGGYRPALKWQTKLPHLNIHWPVEGALDVLGNFPSHVQPSTDPAAP